MRVSHHVKRSVCLLLSLLLLAQGMTLGAAAVGTDSVPAGTSVLEPAAYPDSEVLVLYEDGRTEVVVYEDAASLEEGLPEKEALLHRLSRYRCVQTKTSRISCTG